MKLRWSHNARDDLAEIFSYIWEDDPGAARNMRSLIETAAGRLETLPRLGRPGAVPGTRELIPHPSYRVVYEVDDETVYILGIVHTSRQWPPVIE